MQLSLKMEAFSWMNNLEKIMNIHVFKFTGGAVDVVDRTPLKYN